MVKVSNFRIFIFFGLYLLLVAIIIGAITDADRIDHQIIYEEYNTVDVYDMIEVTTIGECSMNVSEGREICSPNSSTWFTQKSGTIQQPILSSRVEKIEDIDGGFREIKNSYSVDGVLSVWKYPIGDRNYEEFGSCRQYEEDKGVCTKVNIK